MPQEQRTQSDISNPPGEKRGLARSTPARLFPAFEVANTHHFINIICCMIFFFLVKLPRVDAGAARALELGLAVLCDQVRA
jgi:hypothetical protein